MIGKKILVHNVNEIIGTKGISKGDKNTNEEHPKITPKSVSNTLRVLRVRTVSRERDGRWREEAKRERHRVRDEGRVNDGWRGRRLVVVVARLQCPTL
jgi:hypothetical protein